jgi:hypothetical protein
MNPQTGWRPISEEEAEVIRAIVSSAGGQSGQSLIDDLNGALVSEPTAWILDVKPSDIRGAAGLPDGPFPARAFVPSNAAYQGEIIVWIANGHVSGLEYAWITDEPPTRWPRPYEMEIVAQ